MCFATCLEGLQGITTKSIHPVHSTPVPPKPSMTDSKPPEFPGHLNAEAPAASGFRVKGEGLRLRVRDSGSG